MSGDPEWTTLYLPVGLPDVLAGLRNPCALASRLNCTRPVVAALKPAHGEALARELALSSPGRMGWLVRAEIMTSVLQKREPPVHGRGEAVELHVPPGKWKGYLVTLRERQLEMAYYGSDFEPPPVHRRPADDVLRGLLKLRLKFAITWIEQTGVELYPTVSWWRSTGFVSPAQLERLELAWTRAHPRHALPARCAVVHG